MEITIQCVAFSTRAREMFHLSECFQAPYVSEIAMRIWRLTFLTMIERYTVANRTLYGPGAPEKEREKEQASASKKRANRIPRSI